MKPKDCVNRNCKNIVYVPDYQLHMLLMCEECINKKEKQNEQNRV
jgi:hypothetical protein